ncbi:MAG: Lin0512 family protein [Anaerolineae bacterium]|nr:Lin0512 family protein [Anaerolineae bacterium]MDW8101497.1 Lin0512 family protein [Anaerolineae bacterium]
MALKKFIVEIGQGIDQHGQDPTRAARKAVVDAISRSCLCGLVEILGLRDLNQVEVEVLVACPYPEKVRAEEVLEAIPFGQKRIEVREGGMIARGIYQPELGDKSDEILVANAAVTVWVKEG